jgi:hypothetical protein
MYFGSGILTASVSTEAKNPRQHDILPIWNTWVERQCFLLYCALKSRRTWQGAAQLRASCNPSCRWYITKCLQNADITEIKQEKQRCLSTCIYSMTAP